jgi:hypothetical protein
MVGSLVVRAITGVAINLFTAGMTAAAFAINFAVSQIVTRVFADNPERQQDMGVRQQVPPSAINAVPIAYGDAYMGGTFVDAVLSTDQKTMYYVLAVSSISPNGQFLFDNTKMYYGDRLMTFDGTDQTKVISLTDEASPPNVDTKINGNLFIYLYRSNEAGTITPLNGAPAPSTVMGGADIAAAQRWTGTRQMNGLAFAIVKLVYNRDAGTTQLSPITFKVAHYLNGAGAAKPGDVWYDYITNKNYGGAVGWLPNGTFDPSFVDSASRTALNAYSDQTITFTNSSGSPSTQARYRINGVLDAGETVLSNIDRIMSSCDSWMTYNAALGQWSVVINKAETAAYAFTDNNIVGDIRVSATDITSSINQVEARFPFKENRDQANFINIKTPTGLLYPNEPVNKYSITYDLVNDSVQAHYLANRLLEQAREDLIVSFNTTYFGIQVDAGDVVSVTNSNYGWSAKLFRVMKVNEASLGDGSLGARLELSEYNAQVYDDQTINQFAPIPNSGLPSAIFFSPLSAPTVSASNPGSAIPNFNISIAIPAKGRVTYSELYYTTSAIPTSSDWKLLSTANTIDGEPVAPSTTYVFANQVLPTGASTTATYYFSYLVGNDLAKSDRSPISAAFTWTPVAAVGPTGPTGALGPTGTLGPTGSIGPTGVNGLSSRICFARVPSNPSPVNGTITTSGSLSFPSSAQSTATWGFAATWVASDPNPSSTDSLYQSDGIYNPSTDQTSWSTPYISSLKVGVLSAITVNTGALTVQDSLTISTTGNIKGGQTAYNTGTGFFLGYSGGAYKFSIGSSTINMTWDGSAFTVTGGVIQTGTTGARLVMGGPSYQQALMGYNTSGGLTLGFNASNGQIFASNYSGGIAGDFDNVSATSPALRGSNNSTGNGVAVEGRSSNFFGGAFYGGSTSSPVYINPTGSLPTQGAIVGALCVVGNLLYFHNGTTWKQVVLL